MAKNCRKI